MSPPPEYDLSSVASLSVRQTRVSRWVAYFFAVFLWGLSASLAIVRWQASSSGFVNDPDGLALVVYMVALGFVILCFGLYFRRWGPSRLVVSASGLEFSDGPSRPFTVPWPSGAWPLAVYDERQAPVFRRGPPGSVHRRFRFIPLTSEAVDGILAVARESGLTVTDGKVDMTRSSQDPGIVIVHNIGRRKAP